MSHSDYTNLQQPLDNDPLLEQLWTPDIATQQGWMFIGRQVVSGIGLRTEFMLYARKKQGETTHFVTTLSHIVICLTSVRQVAEISAKYRKNIRL